ncbi:MAG: adenosylcobinamide amidohydrolase [Acidimicrobiales bacterium]
MFANLGSRAEDGMDLDVLVYRLDVAMLAISSATVGGGMGERHWALNAQVRTDYDRDDIESHVDELARTLSLSGSGIGMLTAANVEARTRAAIDGVSTEATVGLSHPTWAANEEPGTTARVGTINAVIFVPVRLSDAALVNAVVTATEAKSQALFEAGFAATGTPSDAVTLFCPLDGDSERFGGPRSPWGSRIARAVHDAVFAGAKAWDE